MSRRTITVEVLSYDELKHAKHTNGVGELRTPLRRSLWSETEANSEELRQQRHSTLGKSKPRTCIASYRLSTVTTV